MIETKPIPKLTEKDDARFWSKATVTANPDICWNWTAGVRGNGYGCFSIKTLPFKAQRVAYFLHYKNDPGSLCVLHTCDNPLCVNPNHLFLGTVSENNADRKNKGRNNSPCGEKHKSRTRPDLNPKGEKNAMAKLNEKQVIRIRTEHAKGGITHQKLSEKYGICRQLIGQIVNRIIWKHI